MIYEQADTGAGVVGEEIGHPIAPALIFKNKG
ncbi:hypothetical protein HAPAU_33010 [Halalkalicoccus paucihalophilus]|uniref:Uncharacterized protein n=1 Tax=Halalkalicoccus paucihalophilus TaxID=1008153 RepID=A0A151A9D9_9EURY|nr:hypothetical protein HAPAU_33010 [Halalkalicoccus paucihalophilus]